MKKISIAFSLLVCLALLTGCAAPAASQSVLVVTATPEPATVTPVVVVVTATPDASQPTAEVVTATLEPTATETAAAEASIHITSVVDQGSGNIQVNWEASGDFPSGFQVVWSSTNQEPTYLTDNAAYVSDSAARTANFKGDLNTLYFVRVCRFANNACDVYSDQGYVAVFAPTAVPTQVVSGSSSSSGSSSTTPKATATTMPPKITIYKIKSAGYGAAAIYWTARGNFDNGFYILYGLNSAGLQYGESSAFRVTDGTYRVFTVTGDYYKTYYFKICRYTGTSCDSDSNTYSYKFTGPD